MRIIHRFRFAIRLFYQTKPFMQAIFDRLRRFAALKHQPPSQFAEIASGGCAKDFN
jgi:hypothetical protein